MLGDLNYRIRFILSDLAAEVIAAALVKSLVIVGGETSFSLLRKLNINVLQVQQELNQAIVEVHADLPGTDALPIVLKGGSIGKRESITEIYDYMQRRYS